MGISLETAVGIIVFIGIFWWMYSLSKSPAQRKQELTPKRVARQPWDDDKLGGRGNR